MALLHPELLQPAGVPQVPGHEDVVQQVLWPHEQPHGAEGVLPLHSAPALAYQGDLAHPVSK